MKTALFSSLMLFSPLALAAGLPAINIREIVWQIIVLVGIAVVLGLVDYAVQAAPFINAPIKAFVHWALIVIGCLLLIYFILGWIGL